MKKPWRIWYRNQGQLTDRVWSNYSTKEAAEKKMKSLQERMPSYIFRVSDK